MALAKSVKTAWVEALRSGEYTQGKSYLYAERDNAYCCLGVLRNIVDPKDRRAHKDGEFLCADQLKQVGLDNRTQKTLASMNDMGWTFDQIADHIETKLKSVEVGTIKDIKANKTIPRDAKGRYIKRKHA